MKIRKGFSILMVLAILTGILAFPASAQSDVKVTINGGELVFDVPPRIINDRTMVPMRKIFEVFGAKVQWDNNTKTIVSTTEDATVVMQVNNTEMKVNDRTVALDVPPQVIDGRTLVPVRAVAEGLDATVKWVSSTHTVEITKEGLDLSHVLELRPSNDASSGEYYGYGDSRLAEVQYETRSYFERQVLPGSAYEYIDFLASSIVTSDLESIVDFIRTIWEYAAIDVIMYDWSNIGKFDDADLDIDQQYEAAKNAVAEYRLTFARHILEVSIEDVAEGTKAAVIKLSEPGWAQLSTYIGIVYDEELGFQMFSIERDNDDDGSAIYVFCFLFTGAREDVTQIENSVEAFLVAIGKVAADFKVMKET